MQFSTPVPISPAEIPIDYNSKILLLGSCFASHMADKFARYRFKSAANPFGILFQPTAIEDFISSCVNQRRFVDADVFETDGIWHHFEAHSRHDARTADAIVASLNAARETGTCSITNATHTFITLGTAWVYRHLASGRAVANCHKVPQREFAKELLSVESIGESLEKIMLMIAGVNPSAQVIFTISPVRHLKDGFVQNQQSKANLIAAVHPVVENFANAQYFPAYEIMMDELRDYRFYERDMLHPNQLAIDYIWERFSGSWITPEAMAVVDEVGRIVRSLEHRPFNPDTDAHRSFRRGLDQRISHLMARFPHMQF